jgi:hypothetical protein
MEQVDGLAILQKVTQTHLKQIQFNLDKVLE